MLRRELLLAFRSRVTWISASLAALLVGHGFVLAVDIFGSASRSALASTLMRREMDPLAGIVRPTLGGLQLAAAVLVPVLAARVLAADKERRSFGPVALQVGSIPRLVLAKLVAALGGCALLLISPAVLFATYLLLGGHLDPIETLTALLGSAFHIVFLCAAALAAAAWVDGVALATGLAFMVSIGSWALDASEGYSALAWLGGAAQMSLAARLSPFERGLLSLESTASLLAMIAGAIALALVGARFDWSPARRAGAAVTVVVTTVALAGFASRLHRTFDWTESRRASLPPAAVVELRKLDQLIAVDVWLDIEDSRRRQLERDVLEKLRIARGDILVRTPLDGQGASIPAHDDRYGVLVLHVGDAVRETRSTSRREIVQLIFDAAGRPLPDWSVSAYVGYPAVIEGRSRTLVLLLAYGGIPLALLAVGLALTHEKRRRSS